MISRSAVSFMSLTLGQDAAAVRAAIERVIANGWFVLGPEVEAFEQEFAHACGVKYAVGVGNGTDAIALGLRAMGIGAGDEVITAPLSAAYTALAVVMVGATPVFADVDPIRLTLDPEQVERAITPRTRALLPVHLYGQPADMDELQEVASRHGLPILEDCCQAHLATCGGRPVGTWGAVGAFSFYPTKNLGALGDGGVVVTDDPIVADRIRRLRNGGQTDRYHHVELGVNSRLDELQAAVLRARLPYLRGWTDRRRAVASRYRELLAGSRSIRPMAEEEAGHVYHLFVIQSSERNALQAHLTNRGIQTLIHYPVPIPRQPAFQAPSTHSWPVTERACEEILSLPLFPDISDEAVSQVADAIIEFDLHY